MKILTTATAILFFILVISSCQKEVDETQRPRIVNNADSIYLNKLVVLDTTLPVGMDTVHKKFFQYDNLKRIKSIFSYFVGIMDSSRHEFFYQGNDTLPFRIVDHSIEDHGAGFFHYVDTIYFNYADGMVRKDSVLSWNLTTGDIVGGPGVNEFTISGNTVKRISRYYGVFSGSYVLGGSDTANFDVTNSAGNLTAHTTPGSSEFVFVQATYDTKPNPMAKVYRVKYPVFDSYLTVDWFTQKNNPLQVQYQVDHFSPIEKEQYTYIYRTDNYPSSATFSSTEGLDYNKFLYVYTTL
jgi:hypothetical protein